MHPQSNATLLNYSEFLAAIIENNPGPKIPDLSDTPNSQPADNNNQQPPPKKTRKTPPDDDQPQFISNLFHSN